MEILLVAAFSYSCGSIPFGLILTRIFADKDVRKIGSGNIGATNVLRAGNKYLADYSYHTSSPMDRYSKFYQLPDYLIYPPNENHHEILNKLEDPNNPEIPDNFELIYKSSRGTMVYKIYHND